MSMGTQARYVGLVRHYHPSGWATGFYAACVRREDAKRMTAICQHRHTTQAEAQVCADHLADLRNGKG